MKNATPQAAAVSAVRSQNLRFCYRRSRLQTEVGGRWEDAEKHKHL